VPTVTSEQLDSLLGQGMNFAQIGRALGLSREMVRRYAAKFGLTKRCAKCRRVISSRQKFCPACGERDRKERAKQGNCRPIKTFANRTVVLEAYAYFAARGLDVVLNAESGRNDPELWVDGQSVKCNRMVPVSQGYQVRLVPEMEADFWYLSDGQTKFVIPIGEIEKKLTYLAQGSPLQQWRVADG